MFFFPQCVPYPFLESVQLFDTMKTVKSLRKNSSQAGVRPGWTLRLVDGRVVTKIDQLQPPVELQFQRDPLSCGGFYQKEIHGG